MTSMTGIRYGGPGTRDYRIAQAVREVVAWLIVPDPKSGGTFLYCREDGCEYRTRKISKYRRHWRGTHLTREKRLPTWLPRWSS